MRTVFRFKPSDEEKEECFIDIDTEANTVIATKSKAQELEFTANVILDKHATQQAVFEKVGQRLIDNTLEGYNTSVFAYGQTGSGKTHTIFGDKKNIGLSFRCFEYLFQQLHQNEELSSYVGTISVVEIYQNKIYDRLTTQTANAKPLKIISGHVSNLTSVTVESFADMKGHLRHAITSRTTAATNMNQQSSRSHLVLTFNIQQTLKSGAVLQAKLHFVDLAGSERVKNTNAKGMRFKEARSINSSLSALGRVVDGLVEKQKHIPYRDCALTHLLKDSLGGNAMTTMIGCCAEDPAQFDQTLSTLRFIARSRQIRNKPVINQKYSTSQLHNVQRKFDNYRAEADKLLKMQKQSYEAVIDKLNKENEELRVKLNKSLGLKSPNDRKSSHRLAEIQHLQKKLRIAEKKLHLKYDSDVIDISALGQKFRKVMFFDAVQNGDIKNVKNMLRYVDIDSVDSNGEGALAFAIKTDNDLMVQLLLENNANPNVTDKDTISPLMVAVVQQNSGACDLLCEHGAVAEYQNSLGCSALHIASSRGFVSMVSVLLRHTKDVNLMSKRGWTSLMFAAKAGHIEIAHLLLKSDVDVNATNRAQCTALVLAAYSGHADMVGMLLNNKADFNIRDKFGMSAHIWAVKKRYQKVAAILSACGSKLSMRDKLHTLL